MIELIVAVIVFLIKAFLVLMAISLAVTAVLYVFGGAIVGFMQLLYAPFRIYYWLTGKPDPNSAEEQEKVRFVRQQERQATENARPMTREEREACDRALDQEQIREWDRMARQHDREAREFDS